MSKPSTANHSVAYRAYGEHELICLFKCIYACLVWRAEIVIQEFFKFFVTFGKPHHSASKDSLGRWLKELMRNSGIDTEIFKPPSTRVASNSAVYKLGMD